MPTPDCARRPRVAAPERHRWQHEPFGPLRAWDPGHFGGKLLYTDARELAHGIPGLRVYGLSGNHVTHLKLSRLRDGVSIIAFGGTAPAARKASYRARLNPLTAFNRIHLLLVFFCIHTRMVGSC